MSFLEVQPSLNLPKFQDLTTPTFTFYDFKGQINYIFALYAKFLKFYGISSIFTIANWFMNNKVRGQLTDKFHQVITSPLTILIRFPQQNRLKNDESREEIER